MNNFRRFFSVAAPKCGLPAAPAAPTDTTADMVQAAAPDRPWPTRERRAGWLDWAIRGLRCSPPRCPDCAPPVPWLAPYIVLARQCVGVRAGHTAPRCPGFAAPVP